MDPRPIDVERVVDDLEVPDTPDRAAPEDLFEEGLRAARPEALSEDVVAIGTAIGTAPRRQQREIPVRTLDRHAGMSPIPLQPRDVPRNPWKVRRLERRTRGRCGEPALRGARHPGDPIDGRTGQQRGEELPGRGLPLAEHRAGDPPGSDRLLGEGRRVGPPDHQRDVRTRLGDACGQCLEDPHVDGHDAEADEIGLGVAHEGHRGLHRRRIEDHVRDLDPIAHGVEDTGHGEEAEGRLEVLEVELPDGLGDAKEEDSSSVRSSTHGAVDAPASPVRIQRITARKPAPGAVAFPMRCGRLVPRPTRTSASCR